MGYGRTYWLAGGVTHDRGQWNRTASFLLFEGGVMNRTAGFGAGLESRLVELASIPGTPEVGAHPLRITPLPLALRWHLLGWYRPGILEFDTRKIEHGYWVTRENGVEVSREPGERVLSGRLDRNEAENQILDLGLFGRGAPLSFSRGKHDEVRSTTYDPFVEAGAFAHVGIPNRSSMLGLGLEVQGGVAQYSHTGSMVFLRLEMTLFGWSAINPKP
jgi:hypothetical protein